MPKEPTKPSTQTIPSNATAIPTKQGANNSDYDTLPSYLYFIKAAQEGNSQGMNMALTHIANVRGGKTATDMAFLAKNMQKSSINDLSKRGIVNEANPEMRKLYSMINENPHILNNFQFQLPSTSIAQSGTLQKTALGTK